MPGASTGHIMMVKSNFHTEAASKGWTVKDGKGSGEHLVATRDGVKMEHWSKADGTSTIKTTLDHPKFSKDTHWNKDCYRHGLSDDQVKNVLENPRAHTGQGYIPRKKN